MTKRRAWDVGVGSCKLKRPNEDKVRLMLAAIVADKTSASAATSSSMDDKALKAVDLNRQMSTQNVGDVHERICREMPMPSSLVEKIVAFHFGQLSLTVENLTQYYLFLETRFRKFAHALHAFQNLGEEDQEILLTTNAPFYFQVILPSDSLLIKFRMTSYKKEIEKLLEHHKQRKVRTSFIHNCEKLEI
jgi:hypothetical protein